MLLLQMMPFDCCNGQALADHATESGLLLLHAGLSQPMNATLTKQSLHAGEECGHMLCACGTPDPKHNLGLHILLWWTTCIMHDTFGEEDGWTDLLPWQWLE